MRTRRAPSPRGRRKAPAGIPALLPKLRAGRVTADAFFRATADDFLRMGAKLMKSYDLPACVELEDVAQELRIQLLAAVPRWDCTAGKGLAEFVIFVAHSKTRKWLDRAREASRSTKESRAPLLLIDAVEREEREALLSGDRGEEPSPDQIAVAQERVDLARKIAVAVGMTVEELSGALGREDVRERVRCAVLDDVFAGEWEGSRARAGADFVEEWRS